MRNVINLFLSCLILMAVMPANAGLRKIKKAKGRPTVAVVLAGGGAKGVAHIEALRQIEEAGIPIDLIVGTSMGSIVGGAYSMGYSPDSLVGICKSSDWMKLILDNPDYASNTISARQDNEIYILRTMVDPTRVHSETGMGGIIQGLNVMNFLNDISSHLPDSIDFLKLPVAFACVGTECKTGTKEVFTQGKISKAIRASMSIPTVFTPEVINGKAYIDGGVVDNYPVDVAREMGADIIIGVNLVQPNALENVQNSAIDVLLNVIDMISKETIERNIKDTDLYIPIDVTGYNAASFGAEAVDTLLCRGKYYAELRRPALDSLSQVINAQNVQRARLDDIKQEYAHLVKANDEINILKTTWRSLRNSSLNVGGRFDNQEYASLLLGLNLGIWDKREAMLKARFRLGQRVDIMTEFGMKTFGTQRIALSYDFRHQAMETYYNGDSESKYKANIHTVDLHFNQEWREWRFRFGLAYQANHYYDFLSTEWNPLIEEFIKELTGIEGLEYFPEWEKLVRYYILCEFNNLDRQNYPRHGVRTLLKGELITDNFYSYKGKFLIPIVSANIKWATTANRRFTFSPHLKARVSFFNEDAGLPVAAWNYAGVLADGMYMDQAFRIAGFNQLTSRSEKGIGLLGFDSYLRFYRNHYITLASDVVTSGNRIEELLKSESTRWGIQGGYTIMTGGGPIELIGMWNDYHRSFQVIFNAGFYF